MEEIPVQPERELKEHLESKQIYQVCIECNQNYLGKCEQCEDPIEIMGKRIKRKNV